MGPPQDCQEVPGVENSFISCTEASAGSCVQSRRNSLKFCCRRADIRGLEDVFCFWLLSRSDCRRRYRRLSCRNTSLVQDFSRVWTEIVNLSSNCGKKKTMSIINMLLLLLVRDKVPILYIGFAALSAELSFRATCSGRRFFFFSD